MPCKSSEADVNRGRSIDFAQEGYEYISSTMRERGFPAIFLAMTFYEERNARKDAST
ncbi:hypothetical protein BRPE67_DCDS05060 (plasmid) [Caballeronia cordobensis]|nr:hypothetical protein BRPE67_DCDS05060 [Burkholderia sp. RPE67]